MKSIFCSFCVLLLLLSACGAKADYARLVYNNQSHAPRKGYDYFLEYKGKPFADETICYLEMPRELEVGLVEILSKSPITMEKRIIDGIENGIEFRVIWPDLTFADFGGWGDAVDRNGGFRDLTLADYYKSQLILYKIIEGTSCGPELGVKPPKL